MTHFSDRLITTEDRFEDRFAGSGTSVAPDLSPLLSLQLDEDDIRPIDGGGFGSHPDEPGSVEEGREVIRLAPAAYEDGASIPVTEGRPSPREISNEIFAQEGEVPNEEGASDLLWVWAQFMDHDITLTPPGGEPATLAVPAGDPILDPDGTGTATIRTSRTTPLAGTGEDGIPGSYENLNTPFIDGSAIYGSDPATAQALRAEGGYLRTGAEDTMPIGDDGRFLAGDIRAGENAGLASLQTVWLREHNRWVDQLSEEHPDWSGDQLYEHARAIVTAEVQSITVNEFLPLLLGENGIGRYDGFDAEVNPQVSVEFNTAAYRLGHTLLSPEIGRAEENGDVIPGGNLSLRDAFNDPSLIEATGPAPILRGLAASDAQAVDAQVVDGVRNFLFGAPGEAGLDLVSLNIFRARDHGIPSFNEVRKAVGLEPYEDFRELTDDGALASRLEALYGSIDQLDLFVGGLVESPRGDSMLGPTFHRIVSDQFTRIRDGDPFWYERTFTDEEVDAIESASLSDVITRNTDIDYLQENALETATREGGDDGDNEVRGTGDADLLVGFDGDDELYGEDGADTLYGGAGDDILDGGEGQNVLHGEDGADTFVIDDFDDRRQIADFNAGEGDRIELRDLLLSEGPQTPLPDFSGDSPDRDFDRFGGSRDRDVRFERRQFERADDFDGTFPFEDFASATRFSALAETAV